MLQYKGKSLNKVYAEPGKVWNFIFEIPGLEKAGKEFDNKQKDNI